MFKVSPLKRKVKIAPSFCQEMQDTSTLILVEEKKNLIKKENDTRNSHSAPRVYPVNP
jgi:hypothetical protein